MGQSTVPRFREYEEKKLRSPACSRRKNANFHLIFKEPGVCGLAEPCMGYKFVGRNMTASLSHSRHHMRLIKGWRPAGWLATRCRKLQIADLLLTVRSE